MNAPSFLFGIAGGSGSGKSTLAIEINRRYPDECVVVHLDDYFVPIERTHLLAEGMPFWDHPSAVRFDDLYRDLDLLKSGSPIDILTKSELYNPSYDPALRNKISCRLSSKPVILFEGFLSLWDTKVRSLIDFSVYLEMPIDQSYKRRGKNKIPVSDDYYKQGLLPAHSEFVEPTKKYADLVIDASSCSLDEMCVQVETALRKHQVL